MKFIHIGGHEGYDHIFRCAKAHKWNGVVVEPSPWLFDALIKRYEGLPVACEMAAVSDVSGEADFYSVDPAKFEAAGFSKPWPDYNGTLHHDFFAAKAEHKDLWQKFTVQTLTVKDLMVKHGIDKLDLLSIDAERSEGMIIKSLVDVPVLPLIVMFEHMHMDDAEYVATRKLLEGLGYGRAIQYVRDTLVIRPGYDEIVLRSLLVELTDWWWTDEAKGYESKCRLYHS